VVWTKVVPVGKPPDGFGGADGVITSFNVQDGLLELEAVRV
jgi:hypothetical protein